MEPIRILNQEQMEAVDRAALAILERTGVKMESSEAIDAMERFGCRVERHAGVVRIPKELSGEVVERLRADYDDPQRPERMPVRFSHV